MAVVLAGLWFALGTPGSGWSPSLSKVMGSAVEPASGDFSTSWQDETQYIVESVLLNLAGMSNFAKSGKLTKESSISVRTKLLEGGKNLEYAVEMGLPGGTLIKGEVSLGESVWSPETYSSIASELWGTGAPPSPSAESLSISKNLWSPTPESLIKVDEKLSLLLEQNPASPEIHINAAILIGAFALREASGKFFTIREELNRMTAHLAFASAIDPELLSPKLGTSGDSSRKEFWRLAMTILLALQNNQSAALRLLETLPSNQEFDPWKSALRARITGDWRPLLGSSQLTLMESREALRAACGSLSAESVLADPKWSKILEAGELAGPGATVISDSLRIPALDTVPISVGHILYASSSLLLSEMAESRYVYEKLSRKPVDNGEWIKALNASPVTFGTYPDPSPGLPVRILSWPLWASQAQRHICSAAVNQSNFLEERLGVPREAASFRAEASQLFSPLRLYPFVKVLNSVEQAEYENAQDEARKVMMSFPQAVGPEIWNHTCYYNPNTKLYIPPPHAYVNEWHRHNPPPGTAYDPLPRMNQPSLTEGAGAIERLEEMNRLAPFDMDIAYNLLRIKKNTTGQELTYKDRLTVYAPLADYNLSAILELANASADNPQQFEEWMKKAIPMNPDSKHKLAGHYRSRGLHSKAVSLYLEWIGETLDLVPGSTARYVVNYLEDSGLKEAADKVADRVAQSYSSAGILTKASLLERRGDWMGAQAEHQKIVERYETTSKLAAFFLRGLGLAGTPAAPPEIQTKMRASFAQLGYVEPSGILTPFSSSSSPPKSGVLVQINDSTTSRVGLREGDIITAVRGYHSKDWRTFRVLADLKIGEPYEVTVWRSGSYTNIAPVDFDHKFSTELENWEAGDVGSTSLSGK
jgi:hypothetical protein